MQLETEFSRRPQQTTTPSVTQSTPRFLRLYSVLAVSSSKPLSPYTYPSLPCPTSNPLRRFSSSIPVNSPLPLIRLLNAPSLSCRSISSLSLASSAAALAPIENSQQRLTHPQLLRPSPPTQRHHPTAPALHIRTSKVGRVSASATQRASPPRTRVGHRVARDRAHEQTLLSMINLYELISLFLTTYDRRTGVYNHFALLAYWNQRDDDDDDDDDVSCYFERCHGVRAHSYYYWRIVMGFFRFLFFSSLSQQTLSFLSRCWLATRLRCWLPIWICLSFFFSSSSLGFLLSDRERGCFRRYMYYGCWAKGIVYAVTGLSRGVFWGFSMGSVRAYVDLAVMGWLGKIVCVMQMQFIHLSRIFF